MSTSINIVGYSSVEEPEFKKHFAVVKFCLEMKVSFPKETNEFFEGALGGEDLNDYDPESIRDAQRILRYLGNGMEVDIDDAMSGDGFGNYVLLPQKLPKHIDKIKIELS